VNPVRRVRSYSGIAVIRQNGRSAIHKEIGNFMG
jgi:hypothetical protein